MQEEFNAYKSTQEAAQATWEADKASLEAQIEELTVFKKSH